MKITTHFALTALYNMLRSDVIWSPELAYTSKSEWEPVGFFSEGLCNAKTFDLMLGFFSSAAIRILSDGFATFMHDGGQMRLIINDILSEEDKSAINKASEAQRLPFFDLSNIKELKDTLSKRDTHFFECLSWLIRKNRIDIRIVRPASNMGIAHTKCGVFKDGANTVAFSGSANFSYSAFIQNYETLNIFCDWNGASDLVRISHIEEIFGRTFNGENPALKIVEVESVKTQIVSSFQSKELKQLLNDELELLKDATSSELPHSVVNALTNAKRKVKEAIDSYNQRAIAENNPHFPYPNGPREYQISAFESWKSNRQRGLFAMATGTGKTITSLNCLYEIYKSKGYYKALILVPTITLVEQWVKECRKFNFKRIVQICSKNPNWKNEVQSIKSVEQYTEENTSYIFIATYTSYIRPHTFSLLNSFAKNKLLLIADEAHNMGASQIKKKLDVIPYLRRIGLSATPKRQFDDDGNSKVFSFFGAEHKYTFEYTMEEAIEKGVLCRYYYYPHIIELTEQEFEEYLSLSLLIAKFYSLESDSLSKGDSVLTRLLLKRKRIVHKAENKLCEFRRIIETRLAEKRDLKYTLVYVPEGNKPDYDEDDFDENTEIEDQVADHLIDSYSSAISDIDHFVTVRKFTSQSSDRDNLLKDFANGSIQVLTSMKCLDEGVDVPRSELAIFCSSTGNPRQFIQRRGRILRTHPQKEFAVIHDLIVTPKITPGSPSFNLERSLVRSELLRVKDFAVLAENTSDSIIALQDVMLHYQLNLFNNEQ